MIKSEVPGVLLRKNPGLSRQLDGQLHMFDKLRQKAMRSRDRRRDQFVADFEARRARRDRLFARLVKMDDETRRAVDKISRISKMESNPGGQHPKSFPGRRKPAPAGSGRRVKGRRASADPVSINSPTTALGFNEDYAPGMNGMTAAPLDRADLSRRSSLKSSVILEIEGHDRPESPGPNHTENPWAAAKGQQLVSSSRRSSASSEVPELLVTKAAEKDNSEEGDSEDEGWDPEVTEGRGPPLDKMKLLTLLPAPTSARFVGRMHAVVSSGQDRRRRSGTSSEIPETIQEGEALVIQEGTPDEQPSPTGSRKSSWKRSRRPSVVDTRPGATGESPPGSVISAVDTAHVFRKAGVASSWKVKAGKGGGGGGSVISAIGGPNTGGGGRALNPLASTMMAKKKGQLVGRLQKLTRQSSISSHREFGAGGGPLMKSQALQSATKLVGLFLKSHNKRTDEEIMAAFGADEDEDDEEAFEVFKDVSGVPKSKDKGPTNLGKMSLLVNPFGAGPSSTSKFVGMLASTVHKPKTQAELAYEELSKSWVTGIPTSIRFLGRSFLSVPKGPGGIIVTDSPPHASATLAKKVTVDFSHTTNMLTMLAKADIKIKNQAAIKSAENPKEVNGGSSGRPSPVNIAHEGQGRSRGGIGSHQGSPDTSSREEAQAQASSARGQAMAHSAPGSLLESEDQTRKLVDSLLAVRIGSITRWNEHKDVKEDKEREPVIFA